MAHNVWQTLRTEEVFGLRRYFLPQGQTDTEAYEQWVRIYDTLTDGDRSAIRQHLVRLPYKPLLSIVMPAYDTSEELLRKVIASVRCQLYGNCELCIADDASTAQHVKTLLAEAQAGDARIKVIYRETKGHISLASNSCTGLATGEYVSCWTTKMS